MTIEDTFEILDSGFIKLKGVKNLSLNQLRNRIDDVTSYFSYKELTIVNIEGDDLILKPEEQ